MKVAQLLMSFIVLFVSLFSLNGLTQHDPKYDVLSSKVTCEIYLRPGVDKIWGQYNCENCNTVASANPHNTGDNVAGCSNCGKHHGNETIRPPRHIKRGGKVYFIAEASLVQPKDGTEGLLLVCPFCGTNSNPKIHDGCPSCGAEHNDVSEISNSVARAGTVVTNSGVDPAQVKEPRQRSTRVRLQDGISATAVDALAKSSGATVSVVLPEKNTGSFLSQVPTPLKLLAAGAVTAGAIGFVAWGTDTYSEVGVVQQIGPSHVIVVVETDAGSEKYKLKIRGDELVAWRVGEEVEVFYTNFRGAQGAERSDAGVYVPQ
jgi:hypothetical protein